MSPKTVCKTARCQSKEVSPPICLDLEEELLYSVVNAQRHYFYANQQRSQAERKLSKYPLGASGNCVNVKVKVKNGRVAEGLGLDTSGFELVSNVPTSLSTSDFYEDATKVRSDYYKEIYRIVQDKFRTPYVKIVHQQLRNADKLDEKCCFGGSIQRPAKGIHTDTSFHSAREAFVNEINPVDDGVSIAPKNLLMKGGSFVHVNVWRNISEVPVSRDPIAFLDERSTVKPDDYIETEFVISDTHAVKQYKLNCAYAHKHEWYYFPALRKDEVILFKQFDSDVSKAARHCFHTSFPYIAEKDFGLPRQSIETRVIVFIPSTCHDTAMLSSLHSTNSLPIEEIEVLFKRCKETEVGAVSHERANEFAQKLMKAIGHLRLWPPPAIEWLKDECRTENGCLKVACLLCNDQDNQHNMKYESPAMKELVVRTMINNSFIDILRANVDVLELPPTEKEVIINKILTATALVASGFILSYICQARK